MPIPKKLFQTAKSFEGLPDEIKENIGKLKELNPDWTYSFYDDVAVKKYLQENLTPDQWALVETVNPKYGVVLADLFRYLVVYNEGGVYLDIKSTALRPFSEAIDPGVEFVISQWPNKLGQQWQGYGLHPELAHVPGGEFQQWNIIAAPRHAFLMAAVKQVLHNIKTYSPGQYGTDAFSVLRLSGPIAYTKAIYPLLDHFPHAVVDISTWGIVYSIYGDSGRQQQQHQTALSGHYSRVKEPLVLREIYIEPEAPVVTRLGDLLASELRENVDLVLKLAVVSIASTITILMGILLAVGAWVIRW